MHKQILIAFAALLLWSGLGEAQPLRKHTWTLGWTPSVVTEKKDAEGNIIETNRPEGYKVYRDPLISPRVEIGEVLGFDAATFKTPVMTSVEGENECFQVTAFNHTHPLGNPERKFQESGPLPGCGKTPVTPVTSLPLTQMGNVSIVPEYAEVDIQVTKPANAARSFLVLDVFDADFVDEGELFINGHGPFGLFHTATAAGNNIVTKVEIEVAISHWVNGANRLRFVHVSSGGYRIDAATVRFELPETDPPMPPNSLKISSAFPAIVNVSRRATDTSSVVGILINKDQQLTPDGIEIEHPSNLILNVSRRADNTSSVVAVLVNRNQPVFVNGEKR